MKSPSDARGDFTLGGYTRRRVVTQSPETTSFDALRAMEVNRVSCVVVCDDGAIVGIVTDRDLAVQVISFVQDPYELRLRTIMSRPVRVVSVNASPRDAAALMREWQVRRLPIVDGAALVGMVTLDDLLADARVELPLLADVARPQLTEPDSVRFATQNRSYADLQLGLSIHSARSGAVTSAAAVADARHDATETESPT